MLTPESYSGKVAENFKAVLKLAATNQAALYHPAANRHNKLLCVVGHTI